MHEFDHSAYGPVFSELLATDRCRSLDQGEPDGSTHDLLARLTLAEAFGHAAIADRSMAHGCLAGVWLLYDFLDESHQISQDINNETGSFWHGIMHRREGDYSNAKYWFRNVGHHAVYDSLAAAATGLAEVHDAAELFAADQWDPMAFVDLCEQAVRRGENQSLCQAVQQAEWEQLFDYCYRQATG